MYLAYHPSTGLYLLVVDDALPENSLPQGVSNVYWGRNLDRAAHFKTAKQAVEIGKWHLEEGMTDNVQSVNNYVKS